MSTHDLGWRIEIREPSPDPSVPSSGRLLGYAQKLASGLWEVATRDGRKATVDTRIQALTALASMCDEVPPVDLPEGGGTGG